MKLAGRGGCWILALNAGRSSNLKVQVWDWAWEFPLILAFSINHPFFCYFSIDSLFWFSIDSLIAYLYMFLYVTMLVNLFYPILLLLLFSIDSSVLFCLAFCFQGCYLSINDNCTVNCGSNIFEKFRACYRRKIDSQAGVASTMTNWMFEERTVPDVVLLYVPKVYPTDTTESTGISLEPFL